MLGVHPSCYSHQPYRHHRCGVSTCLRFQLPVKSPLPVVQADGERLLGQCEISHPVPKSDTFAASDLADGMGKMLAQPHNVIFNSTSKNSQSVLPSPISSKLIVTVEILRAYRCGKEYFISMAMGWKSTHPPIPTI